MRVFFIIWLIAICSPFKLAAAPVEFIDISKEYNLNRYQIISFLEDSDGYIWLGTLRNGLLKLCGTEVIQYSHEINKPDALHSNTIETLWEDDQRRLWVGGHLGLKLIDLNTGVLIKSSDRIEENLKKCSTVFSYLAARDGIWLGTNNGLVHISKDLLDFKHIPVPSYFKNKPNIEQIIHYLFQDRFDKNRLWLGTRYGLKTYNTITSNFKTHENPKKWHNNFPATQQFAMLDIEQFEPHQVWLAACWSGGIMKFDIQKNEWSQNLHPNSSLEDPNFGNDVYSITPIQDSAFLFANSAGYGFFNINTKSHRQYNVSDRNVRDNSRAGHLIDRFGTLWYFGGEGVFRSKRAIESFESDSLIRPAVQYSLSDSEHNFRFTYESESPLSFNQRSIQLNLYSINHPPAFQLNLRWRLIGHEKEWNYSSGTQLIRYKNLPAGQYSFIYELAHPGRHENWMAGQPFEFAIVVPIHKHRWFVPTLCFMLCIIVAFIVRQRFKAIRKQEKQHASHQRQLAEIKMTALNSQMNPHFMFNTMNSINHYILKNDSEKASHYLTRFSRLIRQVLYNSRQSLVSLEDELNAMRLYIEMEQLRFDDRFEYHLQIDSSVDLESTKLPPMLFQPYIENAIWHGLLHKDGDRKLSIVIDKIDNNLTISVRDNGIGRTASAEYKSAFQEKRKSVGMSITKDRIELANKLYQTSADIEIIDHHENNQATGTEIIVTIPFINGHSSTAHY